MIVWPYKREARAFLRAVVAVETGDVRQVDDALRVLGKHDLQTLELAADLLVERADAALRDRP